ncbi:GntR family transcriptional regulator, partial [Mesorhizobium sp. M7D.F.Ca.US.004.03.1.1]|uniref:GntR family transcriptional regulator n=1 Tax=Mesorhizobium sp. M7D.F.Ca.US.004.03.1.1 TaxID=2496702 RepID=UPI000FD19E00
MQFGSDAGLVNHGESALLRDIAYGRVLSMIMSGALPAGSTLQERRLAEALGLSRTPIREALAQLKSEGLVCFNENRSPSVSRLEVIDFVEILKVRKLLECEAARIAAGHGVSAEKLTIARGAITKLVQQPSPTTVEHWNADDLVHGIIAEASQNRPLVSNIRDLRRRTHIFDTRVIPDRLAPGAAEHRAILDAVERRDPDAAMAAMG